MGAYKPKEVDAQAMFAEYIKWKHPHILHNYDIADLKLPVVIAVRCKRLGHLRGMPDNFIMEPRGIWNGLFIELKREGFILKKRNGEWRDEHIAYQANMLDNLELRGYRAVFAIGYDEAVEVLEGYLKNEPVLLKLLNHNIPNSSLRL